MRFEDIELTGSAQVTGSLRIPFGPSSVRNSLTGSLFFNTDGDSLEINRGDNWYSGSGAGGSETPASAEVEYLVVAGGGGGGAASGGGGGGGGAGGYLSSSFASITSGSTLTITVGSGGTGAASNSTAGGDGGNSSISGTDITTVTATAGGGGSGYLADGGDGGSGGGGAGNLNSGVTGQVGNTGTSGQGNDGGDGGGDGMTGGGGGGGASAAGGDGDSSNNGGAGGNGLQSSVTGTSTYYAGGGGGGRDSRTSANDGAGGSGGGGTGGVGGTAGTTNTGGGGGGSAYNESTYPGRNGGSGVVILAYDSASIHAAGGISGDAGNGRRYHQFNSSDTFVVGSTDDFNIVTASLQFNLDAGDFASRGTSTWTDLQGNNNGTITGATLTNFYYDFDATSERIATNYNTLDQTFSAEVWVNADNLSPASGYSQYVINKNTFYATAHTAFPWALTNDIANNIRFQLSYGNDYSADVTAASGTLSINTWYHIVGVADSTGNTAKVYVNGSETASATYTGTLLDTVSNNVTIGRAAAEAGGGVNKSAFNGQIAQVRYYTKALSAAEVLQNYNATKQNFV